MPSFCRHNRFIQNCPICREPEPPRQPAKRSSAGGTRAAGATRSRTSGGSRSGGMRVRQLHRAAEDGYASPLVPGLKATADAERLADELAFATGRLGELATAPPGLYADAGSAPDPDEGAWLAAQIVLLGPGDGDDDPFAALREAVVPWAGGAVPDADAIALGPRSPYRDGAAAARGLAALRAWLERHGGPAAALAGDPSWTPERRFERVLERLGTVAAMGRARYDLLVVCGQLGLVDVRAGALVPGTDDDATVAAKRVFGIGDRFVIERRAADLADAAAAPIAALDLALANVGRPPTAPRIAMGATADAADPEARELAAAALGLA